MASTSFALPDGPRVKRRRLSGKQPDPRGEPSAFRSELPTGPRMTFTRSRAAGQLSLVVIDNFDEEALGLAPLAGAAGPLKDLLTDALTNAVMFKLKVSITWEVSTPMDEIGATRDFSMNFIAINVHQDSAPLGGGGVPRIAALLQKVRQTALDKIEFAKLRRSGIVFHRIKEIRFAMIPHPRELTLADRWGGVLPPELADGGCTAKMPEARRALLTHRLGEGRGW